MLMQNFTETTNFIISGESASRKFPPPTVRAKFGKGRVSSWRVSLCACDPSSLNVNGVTSRENGNYVLPFSLFRPVISLPSDQTLKEWRSRRKSLSLLPIFFIWQVPLPALTNLTAGFSRAAARKMCVGKNALDVRSISSVVLENAAEILVVPQRTAAIARPVGSVISESAARIMSAGRRAQTVDVEKLHLLLAQFSM